jgi:protein-S-isoprenylcysteine O-methyltransferase Ste14
MLSLAPVTRGRPVFAFAYAWAAAAVMWAFWVSFVIFLAEPRQVAAWWPLPTIDRVASPLPPILAAAIDLALVAAFGLQHSVMARPWFKRGVMSWMPEGLERATYVHMANVALFILILFWQPIPAEVWNLDDSAARDVLWLLFGIGWAILFLGAWSFGLRELLGLKQVRAWTEGRAHVSHLRTHLLYRWLRHPMYVGVLLGVWATPRMSCGHLLLALALTVYVLIAMRYEERDLLHRFGRRYADWRGAPRL